MLFNELRQTINILNQSDPFTNKSSSSEAALKTLAAGVRATHKRDAHGRLAAQRVMMDSTRLYNAALSNSFIAQMLKRAQGTSATLHGNRRR